MSVACRSHVANAQCIYVCSALIYIGLYIANSLVLAVVADALNNVAKLIASALRNVVIANLAAPLVAADVKLIFRRFARDFLMQMSPWIKQYFRCLEMCTNKYVFTDLFFEFQMILVL